MTSLPCGADAMRDDSEAHSYLIWTADRDQRLRPARRDAGDIVAEITWCLICKNDRRAILLVKDDRSVRAGRGAIAALRASFQKQRLGNSTGRTQPICPQQRSRSFRHNFLLFGKLLRRLGNGDDRVLEEIAPAICRIVRHKSNPT